MINATQRPSKAEKHTSKRILSEIATIEAMVTIYCNYHHKELDSPCPSCSELLLYAKKRLFNCPYGNEKPTCGKCTIHCYKKDMQQEVKRIMRFSGPRMILHHPVMTLQHLLDGLRKIPSLKNK